MSDSLSRLMERIEPYRQQLASHSLYASFRTMDDLHLFMQSHVYAVWDFMSLLKQLQRGLTCIDVPWLPTSNADARRFINEIVLGEESDHRGEQSCSHFELYLEAMRESGADTQPVEAFIAALRKGESVSQALTTAKVPAEARAFVETTFKIIDSGSFAATAAAFTFGREDVIPDMFRGFVRELNSASPGQVETFLYYLERHIELDGDDHGPIALKLMENLCGSDAARWQQATEAAETALRARIALWNAIEAKIHARKPVPA